MATYNSRCNTCNKVHEYVTKIDLRNNTPICCGVSTEKVILETPLMAMIDDKPWLKQKGS